ncbi:hypothetical protein KXW94_002763 [Aspergillus fumigatus]|nr:hypothetical protein KXW94_002763 [Aspergillus fumigatus]
MPSATEASPSEETELVDLVNLTQELYPNQGFRNFESTSDALLGSCSPSVDIRYTCQLSVVDKLHEIYSLVTSGHYVTNAIYAFDLDNIMEPLVSFWQRLLLNSDRYVYDKIGAGDDPDDDESDFKAVEFSDPEDALLFEPDPEEKYACWDVKYIRRLFGFETIQHAPAWQELGKVRMPPGRLISFPNAFQYRMGPLELQDKTKPGHCRFLTLSLVDPMYRICSTRNVPPQQPDWIDGSEPHMDLKEALKLKEELMNVHVRKDEATFELAGNIVFTGFQ